MDSMSFGLIEFSELRGSAGLTKPPVAPGEAVSF